MRLPRSVHLGEFRSPRWHLKRTWTWGEQPDHPQERDAWRVRVEVDSKPPVRVAHRRMHWGPEWGLHTENLFALTIARGVRSGTSSVRLRSVNWQTLGFNVLVLGTSLGASVRWPHWTQSREDYLHDRDLDERRYQAYLEAKRRAGCESKPQAYAHLETSGPSSGPDIVRPGPDGEPVLVRTDVRFRCAGDNPACRGMYGTHWVYDDDIVAVAHEEFMSIRRRREQEEAERLAEVAQSIREVHA